MQYGMNIDQCHGISCILSFFLFLAYRTFFFVWMHECQLKPKKDKNKQESVVASSIILTGEEQFHWLRFAWILCNSLLDYHTFDFLKRVIGLMKSYIKKLTRIPYVIEILLQHSFVYNALTIEKKWKVSAGIRSCWRFVGFIRYERQDV